MSKKTTLFGVSMAVVLASGAEPLTASVVSAMETPLERVSKAYAADEETWVHLGEGEYSDVVLSNLFKGFFNDPVKVNVEESEQTPGRYRVVNPWSGLDDDAVKYLIIDATDPDFVMIPEQVAPIWDPEDGETHFRSINEWATTDMGLTKEQFLQSALGSCNSTLKDGVISLPKNILGVMWPDPVSGISDPGVWTISNGEYDGYLVLPGHEVSGEWESLGMGRMLDGFVWPVFEPEGAVPEEKEVEVMRHKETAGLYKVVRPFLDSSSESRDLIIDASDPGFVRIGKQNTGIKSKDYGYVYIISASANGYLDYDDFIDSDPDNASRNITLRDDVFNIPATSVLFNFPDIDPITIYPHSFSVDSYVKLPSTNSVGSLDAVDGQNETEYYNLQGIRLAIPVPGQIVIKRCGGKAFRMIFR